MNKMERLSVPSAGRTVSAAVEERAVHVRKAVELLEPELRSHEATSAFSSVFAPRWISASAAELKEPTSLRAAWALANIWILARRGGAVSLSDKLVDAERWFFGAGRELPSLAAHVAVETAGKARLSLSQFCFDEHLLDLLPYVLEVHGPGSRASVMRDPTTATARAAKRLNGVFYTPADVAEYMAAGVLVGRESSARLRFLDPSCGTGVFFVALMHTALRHHTNGKHVDLLDFATGSLYGFDFSTLAIESATFVLLNHCISDVARRQIAPWAAWHALRLNLTATDSLRVGVPQRAKSPTAAIRCRSVLKESLLAPSAAVIQPLTYSRRVETNDAECRFLTAAQGLSSIGDFFPEAETGFDVVICNPPYADLLEHEHHPRLQTEYRSLRSPVSGKSDLYPMFIEMTWRLTRPGSNTSAVVVPLSISYHRGEQYKACRQGMAMNGGRWRCAFFDREPHALFGEDVKTRNAILFRSELSGDPPRGEKAEFETGPLRKWTSRTRDKLLSSISFTPLRRLSVTDGLPKLHGVDQANAFLVLANNPERLKTLSIRCRTCQPQEATVPGLLPRVFVASTAYNFLNVFRSFTLDFDTAYPLSENTVHCLEFEREDLAEIAFAVLSSRLTFWLWQVQGDAFHVGASFIQNLPFGRTSFSREQMEALCAAAHGMWRSLQSHRIVSINKGKETIAFRPLACEKERDLIDSVLIDAVGLPKKFAAVLRKFVHSTVVVDEADVRRSHLKAVFEVMENAT